MISSVTIGITYLTEVTMTPEEEVRRGREAAIVTGNQIYQEALIIIKTQMLEQFQKTEFEQSAARDEIWRQMKIVDWFERQLEAVMQTGKMGQDTINLQGNDDG